MFKKMQFNHFEPMEMKSCKTNLHSSEESPDLTWLLILLKNYYRATKSDVTLQNDRS